MGHMSLMAQRDETKKACFKLKLHVECDMRPLLLPCTWRNSNLMAEPSFWTGGRLHEGLN